MQDKANQPQVYTEDEIDLRELFKTILKNKVKITIITLVITAMAVIYVFVKTPIYGATALVEIGNYKKSNNNGTERALLDNGSELVKKLNVLFIDMYKNQEDLPSEILSIKLPKKQKNFIEIKAEGISNKEVVDNINKVYNYIRKKHQMVLDDVKAKREFEISNLTKRIETTKTKEIPLLDSKIDLQKTALLNYKQELAKIDKNMKKIENTNPSLAALKLMEKRNISGFILKLSSTLLDMKNKRDMIEIVKLPELSEKLNILKTMLLPHNYKNSEIVGEIITDEHPIKPKKKLIVVVAFITGLILSIFLVFFLEFIKGFKEEEKAER
jgi:hypothetical protein